MSLPPVVLYTTVPYQHPEKTVSRQDFQTELMVVNLTCEQFLATPHITLVSARYKVLYDGRHGVNNHNIFHCRDGLVQRPFGSDSYFKLPGPQTDPATGHELRYKTPHMFSEADVIEAFEIIDNAQPPFIAYTGGSITSLENLSLTLISATLEELRTKDLLLLRVYKTHTWNSETRKGYLYYTADNQIAVCTTDPDDENPAFISLEEALDQDKIAAFRANPAEK